MDLNVIFADDGLSCIGYQTENNRTEVWFNISDIMEEFPGGLATLFILRPGETEEYPSITTRMEETNLVWVVQAYDLEKRGIVEAQVVYTVENVVAKRKVYSFYVDRSIQNVSSAPPTWEDWKQELLAAASEVHGEIEAAEATLDEKVADAEAAKMDAESARDEAVSAKEDAESAKDDAVDAKDDAETAKADAEIAKDAAVEAQGKAEAAQDAAEAAQSAAETAVSHYPVVINGYWNVWDVQAGKYVSTGVKALGEDGFSPTVVVTEIENGHRVTITDASGPHTFDVMDGQGGSAGTTDYNDLTNKPKINNVELSGSKSLSDIGAAASGDIPTKTSQLTNDSGFLTRETDPTVPNWAKEPTKPTYTAQEVGAYEKPAGGIPESDLASEVVQELHGKADKVSGATNNNFAALDANGNLKDSGKKASDFLTQHQDISGKQNKITANGILKGDGNGNVTAATPGTDYGTYSKPSGGIPASDLAAGVIPDPTELINDEAGAGDTDVTFSADKLTTDFSSLSNALNQSTAATNSDIGKAHSPKTVVDGKVTEWQYVEVGGGGGQTDIGLSVVNGEICVTYEEASA